MAQKKNIVENTLALHQESLRKSNRLIGLKYRASVLENKLIYLGMLKVQNHEYREEGDGIYVEIHKKPFRRSCI